MSRTNMDVFLENMSVGEVAEILDAEGRGCNKCYAKDICCTKYANKDCIEILEMWLKMEHKEHGND